MDAAILIAGQALARNLTLVTHHQAKFKRVTGRRIKDGDSLLR
jgi:predicted nucleic acid-binding protein